MSDSSELQFDVVIAGGGFAGVYCARALARELGEQAQRRVALIARENFMVFQPMLAEVVGSALSPRHVVNPLRLLCRGVTVLRADIVGIDLASKRIQLEAGDFTGGVSVEFEHLVLTLGGIVDLSRVPGMPEHAFLMKNVGDALKLRGGIIDRFEEANTVTESAERRVLLTFVVVGGGYSGVETAGQILDLANEIVRFYPRIAPGEIRVVLVHSGAHLLPEISESLGHYTEENLRARGVEVIVNARVTAMTASRVMLSDGRMIESHTVVSTVGNAPHPLLGELCKKNGIAAEKARVITDATLRVPGHERLWAAGDCAAVPMPAARSRRRLRPRAERRWARLRLNRRRTAQRPRSSPFGRERYLERTSLGPCVTTNRPSRSPSRAWANWRRSAIIPRSRRFSAASFTASSRGGSGGRFT